MRQQWKKRLKLTLAAAVAFLLVSGCGGNSVSASYPLESVTQSGSQISKVYRAANETVPQVAHKLADERQPEEMSKDDPERMFLVYPDEWYHLQRDPQKPSDTLIEVDNEEFVRQNYNPSFLEGYILGSLLSDLFDSHKHYPGTYRGYTTRDIYRPLTDYHTPTVQEKKENPPLTVKRAGSIIRRGGSTDKDQSGNGSVTPPATGSKGTIIRTPDSSGSVTDSPKPQPGSGTFISPRSNSPPKTKWGGFGRVKRR